MKTRCNNPNYPQYKNYGGRGIKVCERWSNGENGKSGYECFLEDMGQRPEGLSLDRIDVNGNYEPGNCRWADRITQNRNKRVIKLFPWKGEMMRMIDIIKLENCNKSTVKFRLRLGWSLEEAIFNPIKK